MGVEVGGWVGWCVGQLAWALGMGRGMSMYVCLFGKDACTGMYCLFVLYVYLYKFVIC